MFDVFYFGPKPNLFAFEKPAASLAEAQSLSKTRYYWYIYGGNDYTGFNFDFVPAPWESHYTHVWADQHQNDGNVYLTANAEADKLYHENKVHRLGDLRFWNVPANIDKDSIDYRWSPDPQSPPYIYHFPSQWQSASGVTYTVPGATEIKLSDAFVVRSMPRISNWHIPNNISSNSIEWSWHPNVLDPACNYHFPVQWNWENIGGPEYRMKDAVGDKYITDFVAKTLVNMTNWKVSANVNTDTFDFSWQPHPADPPFIYKFPTVWNSEGGPEYHVPGATNEKYMTDLVAETLPDMSNWTVPEEVNANEVDFSWVPHPKDPPYIYHFGTDFQQSVGLTYTVPGATEIKFAGPIPVKGQNSQALEVLDIFFVDKGNDTATTRYELLKGKYPRVQKVRYANSIIDTIKRCANRSTTNKFWVVSSEYDYTNFNFAWHPAPWQNYMTHVFPSQWQKWSDTFLVNRAEFERNTKWAASLEEFPNLNFVDDQHVVKPNPTCTIYYVDHGNDVSRHQYEYLRADIVKDTDIVLTRFVDNYLDTFKRIMNTAQTEYVWIVNSICNYSTFDFTWEPEPWQKEMIHVFPSGTQDRGDTFYIHVESFKKQMIELELLDWFNVINYCSDQCVDRFNEPLVYYNHDNLVEEVKKYKFETPYALFTNQKDLEMIGAPCLWTEKDRSIQRVSESGATCLVPRDVKKYVKTQLYDYPYLENSAYRVVDQTPLDIVYISNGEPDAEKWFEQLRYSLHYSPASGPVVRLKRVQNVKGRKEAYQAAAEQSNTPWFFAVFAKLEINPNFDWGWQPDYYQEPKHYIFNAHNLVNGLEYGHMGMIAYNKKLVLENNNPGIDFTLSQPHESVPKLSGIAHFNQDAWTTWRTAFREVLKLKLFQETAPTLENEHRLNTWLTKAKGNFATWSIKGAQDAVNYYNEVEGNLEKLQLSFEWEWLQNRYNSLA
jgi:hypothetical protein